MPEYASINNVLNTYRVLNTPKFTCQNTEYRKILIWQGFQGCQGRSEYTRICLDRALNISQVLNLPGF